MTSDNKLSYLHTLYFIHEEYLKIEDPELQNEYLAVYRWTEELFKRKYPDG